MGWDYWTFQSQPAEFVQEILAHMNAEFEAEVSKDKEAKRKSSEPRLGPNEQSVDMPR